MQNLLVMIWDPSDRVQVDVRTLCCPHVSCDDCCEAPGCIRGGKAISRVSSCLAWTHMESGGSFSMLLGCVLGPMLGCAPLVVCRCFAQQLYACCLANFPIVCLSPFLVANCWCVISWRGVDPLHINSFLPLSRCNLWCFSYTSFQYIHSHATNRFW